MRILIIRLSSIGDIILTTPVLKELKKKYPNVKVDFLVLDKFKDAIEGCPYVDRVIIFEKKKHDGFKNLIKFAKELKKNNYNYIFDLHGKVRSYIISKKIGVKCFRYKKRAFWKTVLVKFKLIRYSVDDTIIKNYFGAFKKLDLNYKNEDLNFSYGEIDKKNIEKYGSRPIIAPGASKNTKQWIPEKFAQLCQELYKKYGEKPILIGGKAETLLCNQINKLSGDICVDLSNKLTLKESGALLAQSRFLVTNDSGPFHIARGVKCNTFVIFGPTDPKMFEYNRNNILIYKNEPCAPCSLHGDQQCPKGHFNCMNNITVSMVMEAINKMEEEKNGKKNN